MEYNSFSFSLRRCVHFIICHYLIYVWHKRHFPLFLFLHGTHIVENFHELMSYSVLQCILFGISPASFLFCGGMGNILIHYIICILFFRSDIGLGIQTAQISPPAPIFFFPLAKCHFPEQQFSHYPMI